MICLIFGCPMGEELEDCPLNIIRKLPISQRIAAFEKLDPKEKKAIQAHHQECLARREAQLHNKIH